MRWWVAFGAVAGCSGGGTTDGSAHHSATAPCNGPMSLTAGTGAEAYVALADLDPVTMVHGPQGGWHVETSGLVGGSTGEVSVAPFLVRRSDGMQVAGDQQEQFIGLVGYDDTACTGSFFGVRAFLDDAFESLDTGTEPQDFICSLAGEILTLTVNLTDLTSGATATSTVDVTATLDQNDIQVCPAR